MQKSVAIVVTYNPDIPDTKTQLRALIRENIQVVVFDNASSNQCELERELAPFAVQGIQLLKNTQNVGLAEGQNRGIEEAKRMGATHVIFFDQDSIPEDGFESALLSMEKTLSEQSVKFSAIGPAAYDPISGADYAITKYVGPFIRRQYPTGELPIEATFIISSGSLVRMSVLKEIGVMRPELFIDYVDVEWCLRARAAGYCCFVASAARMSHRIGDNRVRFCGRTISAHSPLRRYYLIRNSFLMLRLGYVPLSYKVREIILNVMRMSVFLYLSKDRRKYLKMMRLAISDGIAGRFGKIQEQEADVSKK